MSFSGIVLVIIFQKQHNDGFHMFTVYCSLFFNSFVFNILFKKIDIKMNKMYQLHTSTKHRNNDIKIIKHIH